MSDTYTHTGPTSAGLVLGNYRILHELSSGGMGTVFRAQHVLLGRAAAVKLLRRDLTSSPELVQRFVNEARAVTACKHPGIVEVYDFGYTEDGHAFIVMEFLEGESLGRRLARQRLTEIEAAAIARGIASALKAAHRVGVIHRDLKPDNVFLVPDPDGGADRTKVLDFGIAKLADSPTSHSTQTGALIGTPLYMAPEQARAAAAIDPRADLYSLGCILYHMLAGQPPFVAEGAGEIIALQMFGEVVPPGQLAPVTQEMEQLVLRLLEKDPADRFATAGEVVNALARLDRRPTSRMIRPSDVAVNADLAATLADGARPGADPPPGSMPQLREPPSASLPLVGADPLSSSMPQLREPPDRVAPHPRSRVALVAGAIGVLVVAVVGIAYAVIGARGTVTGGDAPAARSPGAAPLATPAAMPRPPVPAPSPGSAAAAPPPPMSPVVPAPGPAPSATHAAGETAPPPAPPRLHKQAARKAEPSVGSITQPGGLDLPDRAIEVHREIREVDPPSPGKHTAQGSPYEDTVDLDTKPKRDGEAHRAPSPPSPSKDPRSP